MAKSPLSQEGAEELARPSRVPMSRQELRLLSPVERWRTFKRLPRNLPLGGKILPVACHVGKVDEIEKLVSKVEAELGPIDIVVNNSATNIGQGPALSVTDDMLDKMVEVNVKAALRLVRLTVPKMIDRNKGGSIINIVSIAGLEPQPGGILYSFTKAGLIMMTRSWAANLGATAFA